MVVGSCDDYYSRPLLLLPGAMATRPQSTVYPSYRNIHVHQKRKIKINQFIVVTFDEKNKIKQKMFKIENGRDLRRKLLQ